MKKNVSSFFKILCLLFTMFLVVSVFNAQPVRASPTTWIVDDDGPADFDTIQEAINAASPGDTIFAKPATYYEHVGIYKSDLTLIGEDRHSTIIDAGGTGNAITITASNVNVSNFTIRNSGSSKYNSGIHIVDVYGCSITENKITENRFGVNLIYSDENEISNNSITHNEYGVSLWGSSYNTLRKNVLSNNIYNLDVEIWTGPASSVIHDIDTSNTVNGKPVFYLVGEHNTQIPPNAGYVAVIDSSNIVVENLTLTSNGQGVLLEYSTNSTILNNQITNNQDGICLEESSNNLVSGNNVTYNRNGVFLGWSFNNTLRNNNLANNARAGIWLLDSSDNVVFNNEVTSNDEGIMVDEIMVESSSGNKFYHNNIVHNTNQTYIRLGSPNNAWDDNYPVGGNYWGDYTGIDLYSGPNQDETGDDGIGDTPYVVGESNVDRYPLMVPWIPEEVPMLKISNIIAPSSVSISQGFYISVVASYFFSSETRVRIELWDPFSNERQAATEDVLEGHGYEAYDFRLISPDYVTVLELLVKASYLEGDTWKQEVVGSGESVKINVVEDEVSVASFRITKLYFNVEYDGEVYKAFQTENLTASDTQPTMGYDDADAYYEWKYTKFNWYILDPNDELASDESVCEDIAFAAETALQGITIWVPWNLRVQSEQFREVATWGVRGEICKKVGGMAAAMIPSVLVGGVPAITKAVVSQALAKGIFEGVSDPELVLTYFFAGQLNNASEKLESAADFIEPIFDDVSEKFYVHGHLPQGVLVSHSDMLEFYSNVTQGKTQGFSAMRIFADRFNEGIWGYLESVIKDAVLANLPLSESADAIKVWIANAIYESQEFREFWKEVETEERLYDMRETALKECARKFCEVFNEAETYATLISTHTESGEEVNLLVSTNSVILSKYMSSTEKNVVSIVEGSDGSAGTFSISIPKSFLASEGSSIDKVAVTVDGENFPFTVESLTDTYLIHVQYSHSQRTLRVHYLTYPLNVRVVDNRGQPLPSAKVHLNWEDGSIFDSKASDQEGYAYFEKVALANMTVVAEYKGLYGSQAVLIGESTEAEVSIDVFVELLGFPLTTIQTALLCVLASVVAVVTGFVLIKKWRSSRVSEKETPPPPPPATPTNSSNGA